MHVPPQEQGSQGGYLLGGYSDGSLALWGLSVLLSQNSREGVAM